MAKQNTAPTMKDVAKEAGVSLGTVSKVINGIPVGEEYRKKVEQAIKELDYHLNAYARGLKSNRTNTIAVVLPGGSQGLCVGNIVVLLCQRLPALYRRGGFVLRLVFLHDKRDLGIVEVYGFPLAVFVGLGVSADPGSIVQTVGCKDILVVQQGEVLRRGRGNQRFAHRGGAIRIYQRVAFQIFNLHTAAGTEHCRQRQCYNTQPFPFH